ncbi:MAG: bile acid:sodium symporter [Dysgonamonadaceae bacterium]|jgi:BASS family bile acid:Na+ symporter|nr:bile acid:sodium symporter [Dysgonamonadaceae bacterium]
MNTIFIVLPILTLLMFHLGMELRLNDFLLFIKRPKPIIIGLAGQFILLPLLAFLWGWAFNLEGVFFIGLILIACSPSGSSSNIFSMFAKGDIALAVSLTALSSILTLFTTPVIMSLAMQFVGVHTFFIRLAVGALMIQNIVLMLLPMALGLLLKYKKPDIAAKVSKALGKFAFPALLILITVFFIQHYDTIFQYIGKLGICITLLILSALFCAWLLSLITKLKEKEKRTIIIEVGIQNAAQAIAIAASPFIFNNEVIAIPAIIYALLMNIILLPYIKIMSKR